ncbi:MAG: UDP-N-acetylglucosamine 2-epimerase (non-hydrolyzing) [Pyrinomonadaceae bacterium]|nr:UDP-N-acetylglucosamine 2-epimerase (non-hydrolyzing) [Pyrinomonadaceae bacterium]
MQTVNDAAKSNKHNINVESSTKAVSRLKIAVLFGTRPEIIKLAPVVRELKRNVDRFEVTAISSGQHADLIKPFAKLFDVEINRDLRVMTANQSTNAVCAKVLMAFDEFLEHQKPDFVIVQGDTTTALSGAIAAFNRKIKVAHIEAGLRSGNANSPFPEEMNRRLISQITTLHLAATSQNRENLLRECVDANRIFVTGNPVVDALKFVLQKNEKSVTIRAIINETQRLKTILLTTHRRESFGSQMRENLIVLRDFVNKNDDTALIFPVHPNPNVREVVGQVFANDERIYLIEPVDYADFIALMNAAWLIISDSGGVQEEAPSLGKPLLILRENTERPEAINSNIARLAENSDKLETALNENYANEKWINSVREIENPFGDGRAAHRIAEILATFYARS